MAHENDPRIQTIFAMLDAWRNHPTEAERHSGIETLMEQLLSLVDWTQASMDTLRNVILAIVAEPDSDELIDALAAEADGDRRVYLETTVGNEITAAIQKCGVTSAAVAEGISHKAIREALAVARGEVQ